MKTPTFEGWADDLEHVAEEERELFIFESLKSKAMLPIFGRYFFPHVIKGFDPVPECHVDLCRELGMRKTSAIIFPRSFAKSTWEKIDTIHDVVYRLEPVILYTGRTIEEAKFHFESIKAELENNELLIQVYGDIVPSPRNKSRKWTNKHLQTTTGINLVARGRGKGRGVNIKNQRPTKIIFDDVEDDEQVKSPEQRMKLANWIRDVIIPSLDPQRGFVKMIGTVLARHAEVLKFYTQYGGIFRKAIEDGKSIWPNMWPLEKLEERRAQIGSRAFSKEYLNNPVDDDTALIKLKWIEDNTFTHLSSEKNMIRKVIALDPQSGESAASDFFGISKVAFFAKDAHRYLERVIKGKGSQLEQAQILIREWQSDPAIFAVGIEKVMTQVAVSQLVRDWRAGKIDLEGVDNTRRNIPLIELSPKSKDKVTRMQMFEPAFERGEIHVHAGMKGFVDQLSAFPNIEHDDDVDSFIYALELSFQKKDFTSAASTPYNGGEKTVSGNVYTAKF